MYISRAIIVTLAITAAVLNGQWEPDRRLTYGTTTSFLSHNTGRCLAATGDTVHVVWFEALGGGERLFYKRSLDAGISWSIDTCLPYDPTRAYDPCLAIDGPIMHIVWTGVYLGNYGVLYKRSTDGGSTWMHDTCLTIASSSYPVSAVSGSMAYMLTLSMLYKRSSNSGMTWSNDTVLTMGAMPAIAALDSFVHVIWGGLYYKRSADNGYTWSADNSICSGIQPSIAATGNNVHVVFCNNGYAYYKGSSNNGASWNPEVSISVYSPGISEPCIWAEGPVLHAVWTASSKVHYTVSYNNGISWSLDTVLTEAPAIATWPFVSASGEEVHVIWRDTRDGVGEIYYKRNSTGNIAVYEETKPQHRARDLSLCTFFKDELVFSDFGGLSASHGARHLTCYNSVGARLFQIPFNPSASRVFKNRLLAELRPGVYFFTLSPAAAASASSLQKCLLFFKAIKIDK